MTSSLELAFAPFTVVYDPVANVRLSFRVHDRLTHSGKDRMFADQERQAFDLGRRMSKADFSLQDNPFARIHPRLAVQWQHGFLGAHTIHSLGTALARDALSTKRPQPRLVSVA